MPNEIPVVFHNNSNNDYHFIIKELANRFEEQFECLGENKKSTKRPFQKSKEITKINEDGNESDVNIIFKIKFIDRASIYNKFIIKSCW